MIGRLNHIAIAVPDLAAAAAKYHDLLGAHVGQPQSLPEHGVTVVFIDTGNSKVELLEPLGEGEAGITIGIDHSPENITSTLVREFR